MVSVTVLRIRVLYLMITKKMMLHEIYKVIEDSDPSPYPFVKF